MRQESRYGPLQVAHVGAHTIYKLLMQLVGPVDVHRGSQLVQSESLASVQVAQQALQRAQVLSTVKYHPLAHSVHTTISEQVWQCGIQTTFLRVNCVKKSDSGKSVA